jgi:hypothetical protein
MFGEKLNGSRVMNDTTRHSIYEIGSGENGFIPKTLGHGGLSEETKSGLN